MAVRHDISAVVHTTLILLFVALLLGAIYFFVLPAIDNHRITEEINREAAGHAATIEAQVGHVKLADLKQHFESMCEKQLESGEQLFIFDKHRVKRGLMQIQNASVFRQQLKNILNKDPLVIGDKIIGQEVTDEAIEEIISALVRVYMKDGEPTACEKIVGAYFVNLLEKHGANLE